MQDNQKEEKIRYYLLSKHKSLTPGPENTNSASTESGYFHLRLFPSSDENIALKVVLMAFLEQIIIAKDQRSVEKLIEYATLYSTFRLDNSSLGEDELKMRLKSKEIRSEMAEFQTDIQNYMNFSTKSEVFDILDDFYLLFGNKFSRLIPLLMKALILTEDLGIRLEKMIKAENCQFDYKSPQFRNFLAQVGQIFGKDIKLNFEDGSSGQFRKASIFGDSPTKELGLDQSAINRNSKPSRLSARAEETQVEKRQKFSVKGYKLIEFQILNDMLCIKYSKEHFEFYTLEQQLSTYMMLNDLEERDESMFIPNNNPAKFLQGRKLTPEEQKNLEKLFEEEMQELHQDKNKVKEIENKVLQNSDNPGSENFMNDKFSPGVNPTIVSYPEKNDFRKLPFSDSYEELPSTNTASTEVTENNPKNETTDKKVPEITMDNLDEWDMSLRFPELVKNMNTKNKTAQQPKQESGQKNLQSQNSGGKAEDQIEGNTSPEQNKDKVKTEVKTVDQTNTDTDQNQKDTNSPKPKANNSGNILMSKINSKKENSSEKSPEKSEPDIFPQSLSESQVSIQLKIPSRNKMTRVELLDLRSKAMVPCTECDSEYLYNECTFENMKVYGEDNKPPNPPLICCMCQYLGDSKSTKLSVIDLKYYAPSSLTHNSNTHMKTRPHEISTLKEILSTINRCKKYPELVSNIENHLLVPVTTYSSLQLCSVHKETHKIKSCCVCKDKILYKQSFTSKGCGHDYCLDCTAQLWILKEEKGKGSFKCKAGLLCRERIKVKDARIWLDYALKRVVAPGVAQELELDKQRGVNTYSEEYISPKNEKNMSTIEEDPKETESEEGPPPKENDQTEALETEEGDESSQSFTNFLESVKKF